MRKILVLLSLSLISQLMALVIVDNRGISHEYPYETFFRVQGKEFTTTKELDGEIQTSTWKGMRFDTWLQEQDLGEYSRIKFVSSDRYEVSFNRVEWDTLSCWLAYSKDDEIFPQEQLRVIFPYLRSQYWVRNLKQVHLEDYKQIAMPKRFIPFSAFMGSQKLIKDPQPFVRLQGYRFDDFISILSEKPSKEIVLYSKDGLTQNLSYPAQLAGAVLELTESGSYNLKSPQIPGGMWMKDIIYLQCDAVALIHEKHISALIPLARILEWDLSPEVKVKLNYAQGEEIQVLGDALAEPMIFEGIQDFELIP